MNPDPCVHMSKSLVSFHDDTYLSECNECGKTIVTVVDTDSRVHYVIDADAILAFARLNGDVREALLNGAAAMVENGLLKREIAALKAAKDKNIITAIEEFYK